MDGKRKVSKDFRKYLQTELRFWKSEEIISAEQGNTIARMYNLDDLKGEMLSTLFSVIYLIAASLIGIGIISFVAAHWEAIPKMAKLGILFAAMLGFHFTGFYLWQIKANAPKLGHSLVVLGTLVFGANIGLIAQIYHIDGHFSNAAMVWALGAAVMAYLTGSSPNMFIAIVVSFAGFIAGMERFYWDENLNPFSIYPLVGAVVFWIYCFWKHSVFLFSLSLIAVAVGIIFTAGVGIEYLGIIVAACSISILYLALGLVSGKKYKSFSNSLMVWAFLFLYFFIYLTSFVDMAGEIKLPLVIQNLAEKWMTLAPLAVSILGGLGLFAYAYIKADKNEFESKFSIVVALLAIIFGSAAIYSNCLLSPYPAVFAANLIWLITAVYSLSEGIKNANRTMFWIGVVMLGLLIISRALEYETELMIKAAVFVGCGILLLVGGVIFEKYAKARRGYNG